MSKPPDELTEAENEYPLEHGLEELRAFRALARELGCAGPEELRALLVETEAPSPAGAGGEE